MLLRGELNTRASIWALKAVSTHEQAGADVSAKDIIWLHMILPRNPDVGVRTILIAAKHA